MMIFTKKRKLMNMFFKYTQLIAICGTMLFSQIAIANNTPHDDTNRYALTADQIKTTNGTFNAFGYAIAYLPSSLKKIDFKTIQQQAEQGDKNAQFYLAKFYDMGIHVPQDRAKAIEWYQKSAKQHQLDAMNNLAYYYEKGEGVPQDKNKAIELLTFAAKQNHLYAMLNLAQFLLLNEDVDAQGIQWLKKASEQNFAPAFYLLSLAYEDGRGVEVDNRLALEYLQKSAELGFAIAQYELANYYQFGTLTTLDVLERLAYAKKAYYWANRACVNGVDKACQLKEYYGKMPELESGHSK